MQLQFKNQHIFFALELVWNNADFDYKFKTHINQLVTAHPEDDYMQQVEISKDVLLQIFKAVSAQPEGVAAFINQELLTALLPQLQAESNNDINNPNDAFSALLGIQEIDNANKDAKAALILKGKNKILG